MKPSHLSLRMFQVDFRNGHFQPASPRVWSGQLEDARNPVVATGVLAHFHDYGSVLTGRTVVAGIPPDAPGLTKPTFPQSLKFRTP